MLLQSPLTIEQHSPPDSTHGDRLTASPIELSGSPLHRSLLLPTKCMYELTLDEFSSLAALRIF